MTPVNFPLFSALLALLSFAAPIRAEPAFDINAVLAAIEMAPFWTTIAPLAVEAQRLAEDKFFSDATDGSSVITRSVLSNQLHSDFPPRGLAEMAAVKVIGAALPADRILDAYVDGLSFGPGCQGLDAGARGLFGKPAASLTDSEAAVLAALAKAPRSWLRNPDKLTEYAAFVLGLMHDAGLASGVGPEDLPAVPHPEGCDEP